MFEITKAAAGYAATPAVLAIFNGTNGSDPQNNLIADGNGNLFGTTWRGGANNDGTVFELAETSAGYVLNTLYSFTGVGNGALPNGGLVADANGDLFGTTQSGGANNDGTVFELARTATGYASPMTLVSFSGTNGSDLQGGLIVDANGNLFGTTQWGGANGDGTVFKIARTATGYANTPTILLNFNGTDGANPEAVLTADGSGNLFGTTNAGGANNVGTVFELTNAGFQVARTVSPTITGAEYVSSGVTASSTRVLSGGKQYVYGTTISTRVLSGGSEYVYSGGTANGTTVSNGGYAGRLQRRHRQRHHGEQRGGLRRHGERHDGEPRRNRVHYRRRHRQRQYR